MLNISKAKRQQLYYSKFKYSGTTVLNGSRYLRTCSTKAKLVNTLMQREKRWYSSYNTNNLDKDYDIDQLEKIMQFYQLHKDSKQSCFRFGSSEVGFYTSDLTVLQAFYDLFAKPDQCRLSQVEPSPPQLMYFAKEPRHQYRIYFKNKRISEQETDDLFECFTKLVEKNEITMSGALIRDIDPTPLTSVFYRGGHWKGKYLSSQYYIEYDNEQTLSYLSLVLPGGIFGKKYKMEKRPG
jgi:hypothetical protein